MLRLPFVSSCIVTSSGTSIQRYTRTRLNMMTWLDLHRPCPSAFLDTSFSCHRLSFQSKSIFLQPSLQWLLFFPISSSSPSPSSSSSSSSRNHAPRNSPPPTRASPPTASTPASQTQPSHLTISRSEQTAPQLSSASWSTYRTTGRAS
jgi:hypothetical protein